MSLYFDDDDKEEYYKDNFDAHHFFDDYEDISDESIIAKHITPDYIPIPKKWRGFAEEYDHYSVLGMEDEFFEKHNTPQDLEKVEWIEKINNDNLKIGLDFYREFFRDTEFDDFSDDDEFVWDDED
ncbi:hypothetical protein [Campylobacter ureolyticus]|uniref:hypothetical protein n=1 Tax=Campylobacter ureolyticus TaxID=827 RepID=UPI001FC86331|nr:hypothetical protein [Campylobacter ureolyticus]MCZ6105609.1 hypothetical protein [Campylobacter ureolyticus]MCZ6158156.1 hypothetical protein [Campylobacter ureolyticus]GKH60692.1 hypothetical protein CE91St25_10280 [Campylobacter ureolyticus]